VRERLKNNLVYAKSERFLPMERSSPIHSLCMPIRGGEKNERERQEEKMEMSKKSAIG
jgi:hypothetical protein